MKSLPRLFAALVFPLFVLCVLVGCSGPTTNTTKTLTSIAVTPATPASLKVGATQQFMATGTYSDASTADISSTVTWTSATPATATISATGLATGVGAGTTQITAKLGTVTSPAVTLTVISLTSIAVTPNPAAVAVAADFQFTATGTYSDASTANITTQVTWASVPTSAATIGAATGLAHGVANGTSQITATLGTVVSPAVTLTVGTGGVPVPIAVKIVQLSPTIAVGNVEDFTAQFLMSDGTLVAPTAAVAWSSGTTGTATILANSGIASGVAAGSSLITATSGTLTPGTTTLTVVPSVSRFAYATGQNDVAAASYVVNASKNTLTPFGVVRDTAKPVQILPAPSGKFAYGPGVNTPGLVSLYNVDPKTGVLSFSATFNSGVSNLAPFQSVIDRTGRFIYIVNSDPSDNVVALATDTTNFDGSLTPIAGSPFPVGSFPLGIAEDTAGKFVYVTNNGDGNISGFSVNANGSLSPLSKPTFSTGSGASSSPGIPAIDPTNSFLYVPNSGDGTISIFSIGPAGLLTAVGAPVSTGAGSSPTMVAITPSNKFLYVTDAANNLVVGFTIGVGGTLTGSTTASPYATGNLPQGLAIDVSGAFLVVANDSDNTLTYYSIDSTTGKLTAGRTVQSRSLPFFVNLSNGIAAPVIAPATVEAANSGTSNDISSYTVNAGTGALTAAASSPTAGVAGNNQVAASQTGRFFYTASTSAPKFAGFSVDATAGLTALSASPVGLTNLTGHVPAGIYAEPSDQFFYIGDATTNSVIAFNNGAASITSNSTLSGVGSVNFIAGDSQGTLVFALGAAQIQPAIINSATGPLTAHNLLSLPGTNWTAGAVDASGLFLVAADSTGHNLQSFHIVPVSNTALDGSLTAGPTVAAGSNGPYALTFDPLNRFVFLADLAAGSVKVFTFDPTTGALTAGSSTSVSVNGVTNVAVDATGTYLYVGIPGTTNSNASSVAVYTINSGTGALTAVGAPIASGTKTAGVTVTNSVN